ncbi:MAG: hypothetical protein Q8920_14830 [Bacillota bacterium]|nr:hypothetical protein [Bacillota bacterium]
MDQNINNETNRPMGYDNFPYQYGFDGISPFNQYGMFPNQFPYQFGFGGMPFGYGANPFFHGNWMYPYRSEDDRLFIRPFGFGFYPFFGFGFGTNFGGYPFTFLI